MTVRRGREKGKGRIVRMRRKNGPRKPMFLCVTARVRMRGILRGRLKKKGKRG